MIEQVLDVKGSLRLLRRSWRTMTVVTVIALLLAAAYGVTRPPTYTAKALVLLPAAVTSGGSATQSANSITTDARIATSSAVLIPAGSKVDRSLSLATLQQRVSTTASDTTSVLDIVATGPSAREAKSLADAVADELVSFVTTTGSVSSSGAVTALQTQANQLTSQLATLQKEVNTVNARLAKEGTTSAAGRLDTGLLTDYTSEQTSLQVQLSSLKGQITQTELGQVSANQGTQVIQRATNASSSRTSSVALALAIGLLVGLVASSILVLARHRKDARLFSRDELARALGAPVTLSLPARPKRASSEWAEMFESYEPRSAEQWNVRKVLRELGMLDGDASRLEILTLAGDAPAATLVVQVAISAAVSKTDTAFVFVDDDDSMPALRSACQRLAQRDETPRADLEVLAEDEPLTPSPELTIIGRVVDPGRPAGLPTGPRAVTVLGVSAGAATADELARIAIAAADAGQPIRGIFLANPDSDDETTGRFPDGANRATLVLHRRALGVVVSGRRPVSGRLSLAGGSPPSLARGAEKEQ